MSFLVGLGAYRNLLYVHRVDKGGYFAGALSESSIEERPLRLHPGITQEVPPNVQSPTGLESRDRRDDLFRTHNGPSRASGSALFLFTAFRSP
jgi:hypothetical protein